MIKPSIYRVIIVLIIIGALAVSSVCVNNYIQHQLIVDSGSIFTIENNEIQYCIKDKSFPSNNIEISFNIKGMKTQLNQPIYVEQPITAKDLDFIRLYNVSNSIECYAVTIKGMYNELKKTHTCTYIIIDNAREEFVSIHYPVAVSRSLKKSNNISMEYLFSLAEYHLLRGHYEWLINYGEELLQKQDSEINIRDIIYSIASGEIDVIGYNSFDLTAEEREKYSKVAIYKKCIKLLDAI